MDSMTEHTSQPPALDVRRVADDQWELVAWLWQAYRNDLAPIVDSYPRPDGRYQHSMLDGFPGPDRTGYLAWQPHPQQGDDAPVALALVSGLEGDRRNMVAFWTAPVTRRSGLGGRLALDVLGRHPGPWTIAFQQDNQDAARFWRRIASEAFGPVGQAWTEAVRPVPGKPEVPPDHWIETTTSAS